MYVLIDCTRPGREVLIKSVSFQEAVIPQTDSKSTSKTLKTTCQTVFHISYFKGINNINFIYMYYSSELLLELNKGIIIL